jgi:putative flippase GtrA
MDLRREGARFFKFLVVGTIGFVVDGGTLTLLTAGLHFPPVPSSIVSFLAAVISNFFFNRYWTYPDSRSKPVHHQAIQFAGINLVGLLIRTPMITVLIPIWGSVLGSGRLLSLMPNAQIALYMAWACAVAVVLIWNFVVNRLWTYNDVE